LFVRLSAKFPHGVILLTAPNGKTTTAAVATHLLHQDNLRVIHNQAGANLILGLTATLLQASRFRLMPTGDVALLETDEATMPKAAQESHPRVIMVTNFFRDQLDRYGELSTTVNFVKQGMASLGPEGWLVLNADDPQVAYLGEGFPRVIYFGADLSAYAQPGRGYDVSDARFCPRCGHPLDYHRLYYAHLGDYSCPQCHFRRPLPDLLLVDWKAGDATMRLDYRGEQFAVPNRLPGLYNAYNVMAAVALAMLYDVSLEHVDAGLEAFRPAFGRMEKIFINGLTVWLALVKNPVGFNQVLETILQDTQPRKNMLIIINDRYADGQDVSWLWDVDFETWLESKPAEGFWVSGERAQDMALRLYYAGVSDDDITIIDQPAAALTDVLKHTDRDQTIYITPTYTALLSVRQYMTAQGYTRHFREG
jgi:UDP-N-acetylmuramyl tripeptide synthase